MLPASLAPFSVAGIAHTGSQLFIESSFYSSVHPKLKKHVWFEWLKEEERDIHMAITGTIYSLKVDLPSTFLK